MMYNFFSLLQTCSIITLVLGSVLSIFSGLNYEQALGAMLVLYSAPTFVVFTLGQFLLRKNHERN